VIFDRGAASGVVAEHLGEGAGAANEVELVLRVDALGDGDDVGRAAFTADFGDGLVDEAMREPRTVRSVAGLCGTVRFILGGAAVVIVFQHDYDNECQDDQREVGQNERVHGRGAPSCGDTSRHAT
jgi:hypothetical protein